MHRTMLIVLGALFAVAMFVAAIASGHGLWLLVIPAVAITAIVAWRWSDILKLLRTVSDERVGHLFESSAATVQALVLSALVTLVCASGLVVAYLFLEASGATGLAFWLPFLTVTFALVCVGVACVPVVYRSQQTAAVWWRGVARWGFTIILVVCAIYFFPFSAFRRVDELRDFFGDRDFRQIDGGGAPTSTTSFSSTVPLPSDLEDFRRAVIAEKLNRILTPGTLHHSGPAVIMRRYQQIRGYQALTDNAARAVSAWSGHLVPRVRIEAIMAVESAGNHRAVSSTGCKGLMQLCDGTARQYGAYAGCGLSNPDPDSFDPEKNICAASVYLTQIHRVIGQRGIPGDWDSVVASYGSGEGAVTGAFARLPPGTPKSYWALRKHGIRFNADAQAHEHVPGILAWEHIFRHIDTYGSPPVLGQESQLLAQAPAPGSAPSSPPWTAPGLPPVLQQLSTMAPSVPPIGVPLPVVTPVASSVWYTAKKNESYAAVVYTILRDPDPDSVRALNHHVLAEYPLELAQGTRVFLPESRYRFVHANQGETFQVLAQRLGTDPVELVAFAGTWKPGDARVALAGLCESVGCEELQLPVSGATVLARR